MTIVHGLEEAKEVCKEQCPYCKGEIRRDKYNNYKEEYVQCGNCGVIFPNKYYKRK